MSPGLVLGVAVGGGLGAVARYAAELALPVRRFPVGTLLVNAAGSLLLGLLTGLVLAHHLTDGWRVVLGTGFCGGFTTFSTTSVASVRLTQGDARGLAALNVVGTLALTTLAAGLGLAIGAAA